MDRIPKRALISAALVVVSVAVAFIIRFCVPEPGRKVVASVFVGAWALVPPIWFIYEWHSFRDKARRVWHALNTIKNSLGMFGLPSLSY
jgi:hypothetical protein